MKAELKFEDWIERKLTSSHLYDTEYGLYIKIEDIVVSWLSIYQAKEGTTLTNKYWIIFSEVLDKDLDCTNVNTLEEAKKKCIDYAINYHDKIGFDIPEPSDFESGECQDTIVCPFCGEDSHAEICYSEDGEEVYCEECGGEYYLEVETITTVKSYGKKFGDKSKIPNRY